MASALVPRLALRPRILAQRRQIVGPDGFGKRTHQERELEPGEMVAHQRANLRAVGIALLGRKRRGDLIVERRSRLAPLGLEKGDEVASARAKTATSISKSWHTASTTRVAAASNASQ